MNNLNERYLLGTRKTTKISKDQAFDNALKDLMKKFHETNDNDSYKYGPTVFNNIIQEASLSSKSNLSEETREFEFISNYLLNFGDFGLPSSIHSNTSSSVLKSRKMEITTDQNNNGLLYKSGSIRSIRFISKYEFPKSKRVSDFECIACFDIPIDREKKDATIQMNFFVYEIRLKGWQWKYRSCVKNSKIFLVYPSRDMDMIRTLQNETEVLFESTSEEYHFFRKVTLHSVLSYIKHRGYTDVEEDYKKHFGLNKFDIGYAALRFNKEIEFWSFLEFRFHISIKDMLFLELSNKYLVFDEDQNKLVVGDYSSVGKLKVIGSAYKAIVDDKEPNERRKRKEIEYPDTSSRKNRIIDDDEDNLIVIPNNYTNDSKDILSTHDRYGDNNNSSNANDRLNASQLFGPSVNSDTRNNNNNNKSIRESNSNLNKRVSESSSNLKNTANNSNNIDNNFDSNPNDIFENINNIFEEFKQPEVPPRKQPENDNSKNIGSSKDRLSDDNNFDSNPNDIFKNINNIFEEFKKPEVPPRKQPENDNSKNIGSSKDRLSDDLRNDSRRKEDKETRMSNQNLSGKLSSNNTLTNNNNNNNIREVNPNELSFSSPFLEVVNNPVENINNDPFKNKDPFFSGNTNKNLDQPLQVDPNRNKTTRNNSLFNNDDDDNNGDNLLLNGLLVIEQDNKNKQKKPISNINRGYLNDDEGKQDIEVIPSSKVIYQTPSYSTNSVPREERLGTEQKSESLLTLSTALKTQPSISNEIQIHNYGCCILFRPNNHDFTLIQLDGKFGTDSRPITFNFNNNDYDKSESECSKMIKTLLGFKRIIFVNSLDYFIFSLIISRESRNNLSILKEKLHIDNVVNILSKTPSNKRVIDKNSPTSFFFLENNDKKVFIDYIYSSINLLKKNDYIESHISDILFFTILANAYWSSPLQEKFGGHPFPTKQMSIDWIKEEKKNFIFVFHLSAREKAAYYLYYMGPGKTMVYFCDIQEMEINDKTSFVTTSLTDRSKVYKNSPVEALEYQMIALGLTDEKGSASYKGSIFVAFDSISDYFLVRVREEHRSKYKLNKFFIFPRDVRNDNSDMDSYGLIDAVPLKNYDVNDVLNRSNDTLYIKKTLNGNKGESSAIQILNLYKKFVSDPNATVSNVEQLAKLIYPVLKNLVLTYCNTDVLESNTWKNPPVYFDTLKRTYKDGVLSINFCVLPNLPSKTYGEGLWGILGAGKKIPFKDKGSIRSVNIIFAKFYVEFDAIVEKYYSKLRLEKYKILGYAKYFTNKLLYLKIFYSLLFAEFIDIVKAEDDPKKASIIYMEDVPLAFKKLKFCKKYLKHLNNLFKSNEFYDFLSPELFSDHIKKLTHYKKCGVEINSKLFLPAFGIATDLYLRMFEETSHGHTHRFYDILRKNYPNNYIRGVGFGEMLKFLKIQMHKITCPESRYLENIAEVENEPFRSMFSSAFERRFLKKEDFNTLDNPNTLIIPNFMTQNTSQVLDTDPLSFFEFINLFLNVQLMKSGYWSETSSPSSPNGIYVDAQLPQKHEISGLLAGEMAFHIATLEKTRVTLLDIMTPVMNQGILKGVAIFNSNKEIPITQIIN